VKGHCLARQLSDCFVPVIFNNVIASDDSTRDIKIYIGFILVRGVVHANSYFSGVAALVFVCSIIGAVVR
jgi:hypothetical protein